MTNTVTISNQFKIQNELFETKLILGFATISLHKTRNIVMVMYAEGAFIGKPEAIEIIKGVKSIYDPKQNLYGITYALKGSTVNEEARAYFSKDSFSQNTTIAMAVIFHQLSQRFLVIIYLKFNKPKTPLKVFKNINNALNWINSLEVNNRSF